MKFKGLIVSSILWFCSFTFQADKKIRVVFTETKPRVEIDGFGNFYIITNHEMMKYNSEGVLQKKFSIKKYGHIDYVDAMNPLKILVYYKDFQQVLFLDDQLTQTNSIVSLETLGYEQTELICSSANNGFWIYNKQNNELIRFDADLKPMVHTGNLKRILAVDLKPNYMMEHNSFVYLNCPNEGILVFDMYGTFYKTIPIKNVKEFNVVNGDVFYYENKSLKQYQAQTFNTVEKTFTDTLLQNVYWQNNRFYKVFNDSLVIF